MPWVVQEDRFVAVNVFLRDKQIVVMDPLYQDLNSAAKTTVKRDLGPLLALMPFWLMVGGYYEHNVYNIPKPGPEESFKMVFRKKESLIRSEHLRCSAVVTCLNVERQISGSPSVEAATNKCCKYKRLYACRIFSYADI